MKKSKVAEPIEEEQSAHAEVISEPESEMTQLRELVFGQSKRDIFESLSKLRSDVNQSVAQLNSRIDETTELLTRKIEDNHNLIEQNKRLSDKELHSTQDDLQNQLNKLGSELEMVDTTHQELTRTVEENFDKNLESAEKRLESMLAELSKRLDDVMAELGDSKTDRKTLAKLLSTMASNLESGDNS